MDFFIYICGCFCSAMKASFSPDRRILPLSLPENSLECLYLGRQLSLPWLLPCPASPLPLVSVLFQCLFFICVHMVMQGSGGKTDGIPVYFPVPILSRVPASMDTVSDACTSPRFSTCPASMEICFPERDVSLALATVFPERCSTFPAVTSVRFCKFPSVTKVTLFPPAAFP